MGVSNELIDRIYRALFVYSIGFHELTKKCLTSTAKKYGVVVSIWKVFSILLEYCCESGYKMLVSQVTNQHKEDLIRIEEEYIGKLHEKEETEKSLKAHTEYLQKYVEELENERENQRQTRKRLELELSQNSKTHEEEVALRIKFEAKLNSIHSVYRDLETKYKRALDDLKEYSQVKRVLEERLLEAKKEEKVLRVTLVS